MISLLYNQVIVLWKICLCEGPAVPDFQGTLLQDGVQPIHTWPAAALTLMLLVANLTNTKYYKKPENMTETLAHGYSF